MNIADTRYMLRDRILGRGVRFLAGKYTGYNRHRAYPKNTAGLFSLERERVVLWTTAMMGLLLWANIFDEWRGGLP